MMKKFIENYYKLLTKKDVYDSSRYIVVKDDERDYSRAYVFVDGTIWLFNGKNDTMKMPAGEDIAVKDIVEYNAGYKLGDDGYLNILPEVELDATINPEYTLCKITEDDKDLFDEFLAKCTDEDKEQGQVSCDDDLVYGVLYDGKIVSAASLWYWGDSIADIGVLTIIEHRQKGLIRACVARIAMETERTILWRSDTSNMGSINSAKALGFERIGGIVEFAKEK